MEQHQTEEKQHWATCFFTDILLSHLEKTAGKLNTIDFASLFSAVEGFDNPPDPERFLRDVNNWVPLPILRDLLTQCEKISGRKDFAYHAARAYFDPGQKQLPSLFEIIIRVLNDVRSVVICSNLWGAVQTSYLKLQSFERPAAKPNLYLLAQFDEKASPAAGTIHLLRGIFEGFPRSYPFIGDAHCIEEISQLRIEDIVREFPDFVVVSEGNRIRIQERHSKKPAIEAIRFPIKCEVVPLSREFMVNLPAELVVTPRDDKIQVLTNLEEREPAKETHAAWGNKITRSGVMTQGTLSCSLEKDQIYNAPYSRFRIAYQESSKPITVAPIEDVRREISQLLFDHLKQARQTQTRMIQFNADKRRLTLENIRLRQEIKREYSFAGIIGECQKMQDLFSLVRSAAETDVTVIIGGETGTGKELIARAIHYNSSRKAKRFVAINCGALTETLLESELFGHEKGAFTGAITQRKGIFEAADGGTLFLDEIGEIAPSTQVKLLRVLQEGEFQRVGSTNSIKVDVRIVGATNRNLEELVKSGTFRQDIFYRLNVFPITVPSLRERVEDIPLLVSHFIEKGNQRMNKHVSGVSATALTLLLTHSWPGNVRELENVIQRMMVVAKGEIIGVEDLPAEIGGTVNKSAERPKDLKEIARESSEIIEKRAIIDALAKTGGNVTQTAKALGISRATLQNKMKLYSLRDSNA